MVLIDPSATEYVGDLLNEGYPTFAFPLSFAQQRLWILNQLEPNSPNYNVPIALRLTGSLDTDVLERTFSELTRRHEVLRTTFATEGGDPIQIIHPHEPFVLEIVSLEHIPLDDREDHARQLAREESIRPFDLASGPVLRVRLLRLGDQHHMALMTLHHIVSDGWSMEILVNEVATNYRAFREGRPSPLPELPIQYADYALWQREWLQGEVLTQQTKYWTEHLRGLPTLNLPTDHPRPPIQTFRGATESFLIPADTAQSLKDLSRREGATLFITLLAAWQALLARYSGQEDIVVGSPIANRSRAETDGLIGFFLNMLVLRSDLSGDPSFRTLLHRVREVALSANAHQDVPFEQLVNELSPERDLSRQPLFQVNFILEHAAATGAVELGDVTIGSVSLAAATSKFDITLSVAESPNALVGTFEYSTDLFDASTIVRMRDHFQTLLAAIAADPDTRLSALPILSSEERERILIGWNDTECAYPADGCMHRLFEQQAARTPEDVAMVFSDHALTYAELNAKANQLAHHLQGLGVGPEARVALLIPRSLDMLVGLLGILKSGGAYVPLDPAYPADRLAFVLEAARADVLVTHDALLPSVLEEQKSVICLDRDWDAIAKHSVENAESRVTSDNLAYVIYTSGSTGKPKGVQIPHAALVNFLYAMMRRPGLEQRDVLLSVTSLSFDIAGLELFLPLLCGARVVVASHEQSHDPEKLSELIHGSGATMMQATPATWRMLTSHEWAWPANGLKILCGGEALPPDLAKALLEHAPAVWNMYGPTETTIWSSVECVTATESQPALGQPIANTQIYLLDKFLNPVPIGAAGELYIAGDGVARGYMNNPELTAQKFIPDPFSRRAGARMYNTGDLARHRPDGNIDFLGRADYQVKVRGFRIELGEIEVTLSKHAQVREAVVLAREDHLGQDKRLVAYIVPETANATVDAADKIKFSLFFFGAETYAADNKYELYLKAGKFADQHGFEAIWTPERHFHPVGGLYPNPATLSAALAATTERVKLRGGSVVFPLHHPARIAEEWSVVDNLSNGRVGLAVASGWHPRDFVLSPGQYAARRQTMRDGIATLKTLFRGEKATFADGMGKPEEIEIFPKPIQKELPLWITTAGTPDTYILAGQLGANVLTHLLGQTVPELAERIALYRKALAENGHDPEAGRVSLMIHTFVGDDFNETLAAAKEPFMNYMRAHVALLESLVKSLNVTLPEGTQSQENLENIVSFAFERYARTASLIGTPQSCLAMVDQLKNIGVDELACLVDWMDTPNALTGLTSLSELQEIAGFSRPNPRDLRRYLSGHLPDYMIPSRFVFLDAMPLTPNGKVARNLLPAPEQDAHQAVMEAPRTPVETQVASIWSDVLRVERIGREGSFFELGGHSLLATQVVSRIRNAFEIDLPLVVLFEAPTLAEFAERIEAIQRESQGLGAQKIARASRDGALPLSFAQQRLWFIDQLEPGGSVYNVANAVRLSGPLDTDALSWTLNEIVRRHEVLRTTYPAIDSQPVQLIHPYAPFALETISLEHLPPAEREARAEQMARDEATKPFDLANGPVMRTTLLRLGDSEHVLLLTVHHITSDGWSRELINKEVGILYAAFVAGKPSPLPELEIQYADFAVWQREYLSGDVLDKQMGYWKQHLADLAPLDLPIDHPRPAVATYGGAAEGFSVPPELTGKLKALGMQEGATLFMTVLAAFQVLLARYSGQPNIAVGSPIAGRNRAETEDLLGFFVNTLVLRTDLGGNPSFAAALGRVRETAFKAYAHQDLPFEKLVEELQPERDLSRHPLFQVMLVLQVSAANSLSMNKLSLSQLGGGLRTTQFDLTLNLTEVRDGLSGTIEYASGLFEPETIRRMGGHLSNLLSRIAEEPGRPISQLSLLDDSERHQLLVTFNDTDSEYPADLCAHDLFARQAARTPEALAVVCGDQKLTYAELNAKANQLADYLRTCGVGPEVRVAILTERSLELILGILGILKAGGAYVPLEPDYPAERLAYILADSGASVLLTQERFAETVARLRSTPLNPPLEQGGGKTGQQEKTLLSPSCSKEGLGEVPRTPEPTPLSPPLEQGGGKTGLRGGSFLLPLLSEGGGWGEVGQVLYLDSDWPVISQSSTENPVSSACPQNIAYIMYTSGSTGRPKGVAATHQGITRLVINTNYLDVSHADSVMQFASVAFDASTLEIWGALLNGAVLNVHPPAAPSLHELAGFIESQGITLLWLTARLFDQMVEHHLDSLRGVRQILAGGEALSMPHVRRAVQALPECRIINGYGPTENTTFTVCHAIDDSIAGRASVPIGRPIANTRVYIVDAEMQPAPIGVPGELYTSGDGLARGYVNDPARTGECFVPNPFSIAGGARMYRTGDLARYLSDGTVEYLGRADHQVKIRGFRIELGEIEAVLARHPSITASVAVALEDEVNQKRLVAYVVADANRPVADHELRAFLKTHLPEYMVPAAFVFLEALPLNANGKVDRKLLPAPEREARKATGEMPRNQVEELTAQIWADVLRVPSVGRDAHFFALGGHSLLATQVISRIRNAFHVDLPLRTLFEAGVLSEFAGRIAAMQRESEGLQAPPITRQPRDGALPLSFAQQRLWFLDQFEPDTGAYNIPFSLHMRGDLDISALTRACNEIIRRHEVLRTRIISVVGEPRQEILPEFALDVPVVDLSAVEAGKRDTFAQRMASEETRRPFDLAHSPVRALILRLAKDDHVVQVTMHHIASDGWSAGILSREFAALYEAYRTGRRSPLPELPIQYADYAVWQREWLQGAELARQLDYWRVALAGLAPLELPTDHPRPAVGSHRGATVPFVLSAERADAVQNLSRDHGVTLFMTLVAAWQLVLSRRSGQSDIAVGTDVAGRNRSETEDLIGFFINQLVLRSHLDGAMTFAELLHAVRETTLSAYSFQDLPFERVVEELAPGRETNRSPLFQVKLVLQNTPQEALQLGGVGVGSFGVDVRTTKHDLHLMLGYWPGQGIAGTLRYATDLFEEETALRLLRHFAMVLETAAADPERTLSSIGLFAEGERTQILSGWSQGEELPMDNLDDLSEEEIDRLLRDLAEE